MRQALLIVADPIENLNYSTDSSLAIAEGALELGLTVHWTTPEALELLNHSVIVKSPTIIEKVYRDRPPSVGHSERVFDLAVHYHRILIRKDPPFNEAYTDLCWILAQLPAGKVINAPEALLIHHEKLSPTSLARAAVIPEYALVPGLVSNNPASLLSYAEELFQSAHGMLQTLKEEAEFKNFVFRVLCKPWRGHGGRGIHTFVSTAQFAAWLEQQPKDPRNTTLSERIILQPLLPEIFSDGDRRVFVVNGQVVFDFVRRPAPGKVEANLAQGGNAILAEMSPLQKEVSTKVAIELVKQGILIAGLDFIGDRITEINITSPTGIRTYEQLTGTSISKSIVQALVGKI